MNADWVLVTMMDAEMKNLLVLGGGFAGVMAALSAVEQREALGGDVAVTLVTPSPFLCIRPRLYEVNPKSCEPRSSLFSIQLAWSWWKAVQSISITPGAQLRW